MAAPGVWTGQEVGLRLRTPAAEARFRDALLQEKSVALRCDAWRPGEIAWRKYRRMGLVERVESEESLEAEA